MKERMTILKLKSTLLLILLLLGFSVSCQSKKKEQGNVEPRGTVHEAAFMNNVEMMKAHIAAGSDLNAKDEYGSTAMNIAATFDKPEIAKLLIVGGADLAVTSPDGTTPLHTAAFLCRTEIVKMLLVGGADTELKNSFGATPLMSVMAPYDQVKPIYEQMNKDLGMLGLKLDYGFLKTEREVVAEILLDHSAGK